jgi:formamidopyrimidine-DNA glycosylase
MPELPDIVVYIEALEQRILDQKLERVQIASPFLLRTAVPPINTVEGKKVVQLRRLGKRICFGFEEDIWLVLHLMIAGRLHWRESEARPPGKAPGKASGNARNNLAAFQFSSGTLSLTEAGSKRRASLHLVEGEAGLQRLDPGGLEIFETDLKGFASVLTSVNHTLKRALTDPRLLSGIGNAYSDEILFDARLSPVKLTQRLTPEEIERLFASTRTTLTKWVEELRSATGAPPASRKRGRTVKEGARSKTPTSRGSDRVHVTANKTIIPFPEKVTAFRSEMAVHGKYGQPCPRCGNKIQRIRYASNETNYCPYCQTSGKLLADRALSRLLRADWPRSVEELEGLVTKN